MNDSLNNILFLSMKVLKCNNDNIHWTFTVLTSLKSSNAAFSALSKYAMSLVVMFFVNSFNLCKYKERCHQDHMKLKNNQFLVYS